MSEPLDWLENIAKLAIPAIWLALKVFGNLKKTKAEVPAPGPVPASQAPRRRVPALTSRGAQRAAQAAGMLGRLHGLLGHLHQQRDQVAALAQARGDRGLVVRQALDAAVATELADLTTAMEAARAGGLLDGSVSVDLLRFRFQRLTHQLQVLEVAARLGQTPAIDAVMADAEAIADACLAPLQQFTTFHDVPFPHTRALCLPAELAGGEAAWIGLLGLGVPVVFVPDDFEDDLMRWPSIAHELGHIILHGIPGLEQEMGEALGWTARPDVLHIQHGRVVGSPLQAWSAWREELLADALTVLMLGPAALDGFRAVFARPDDPEAVLRATASNGRYNPHPPAHLRVHLAAFLLEEVGFITEGREAAMAWNALHGFPELLDAEDPAGPHLLLPLADGRYVHMNLAVAVDRGTHGIRRWLNTQFTRLAGHSPLALPGFDLSPGVWARVERMARSLQAGETVRGDGRALLAAAIRAGSEPGASARTISAAVQRSIIGRGEGRSRHRTHGAAPGPDSRRSEVLDALLLQEILVRPSRAGRGRQAGRRSPRPTP